MISKQTGTLHLLIFKMNLLLFIKDQFPSNIKEFLDLARKSNWLGFFIYFLVPPGIPAMLKQQPLPQGELIKDISTYEKELLSTTNGSKDVAQKEYEAIDIEEMIQKGANMRFII